MVFQLPDDEIVFPNPELADADGLLAIGGDLSVDRLLLAYEHGIFPWFSDDDPICWYSPHKRCVIFPERLKVSKSMKKIVEAGLFEISMNQDFAGVIRSCAKIGRKDGVGTWITSEMQDAYIRLHELGYASSVEVWQDGALVGGLYGVEMGMVFCGESMFSKVSNASKAALIWLCRQGLHRLVDCQLPNDHLFSLGAEMIDREMYNLLLRK